MFYTKYEREMLSASLDLLSGYVKERFSRLPKTVLAKPEIRCAPCARGLYWRALSAGGLTCLLDRQLGLTGELFWRTSKILRALAKLLRGSAVS